MSAGPGVHVLISADMEGATGAVLPADVTAGSERYERFRELFEADVNAAIDGFVAAGASRVTVNDAHGDMANLRLEHLASPAELIAGRHKSLAMMEQIDSGVDAVAMIGYHSGSRQAGVLAHTCLSRGIAAVRVDGTEVSEGAFNAVVAHEVGVPVVIVTGDDTICREAAGWAPEARTVTVKTALSRHSAVCRAPSVTAAEIRATAAESLRTLLSEGHRPGRVTPTAHTVEVETDYPVLAERAAAIPTVERVDARTIRYRSASAVEALRTFRIVVIVVDSGRDAEWA